MWTGRLLTRRWVWVRGEFIEEHTSTTTTTKKSIVDTALRSFNFFLFQFLPATDSVYRNKFTNFTKTLPVLLILLFAIFSAILFFEEKLRIFRLLLLLLFSLFRDGMRIYIRPYPLDPNDFL